MTGTVKTMGTDLALRQADSFDQRLHRIELERSQAETLADDFHHPLIFGRIGSGILFQILVLIAFQFPDDAPGNQFERALR